MDRPQRPYFVTKGIPLTASLTLVVFLLLVTWIAGPVLRHLPGAVIPWPAHGIALAIVLSARSKDRVLIAVGVFVACLVGAGLHSEQWSRAIAAAAQVTGQTIVVALLHQRLTHRRHPLRGSLSYAWLGVAVLFGTIPTSILASLMVGAMGPEYVVPVVSVGSLPSVV